MTPLLDKNHSLFSKSGGYDRPDSGNHLEEEEYSDIDGSENDDDAVLDDMKLDDLSLQEVKRMFRKVKGMLEHDEKVSNYTLY